MEKEKQNAKYVQNKSKNKTKTNKQKTTTHKNQIKTKQKTLNEMKQHKKIK